MKLIVGLGNPGVTYAATRHNAGAEAVLELVEQYHGHFSRVHTRGALHAEIDINGQHLHCILPQQYMNVSGDAVAQWYRYLKLHTLEDILVVHDDIDLMVGYIRFVHKGGSGGHKGIRSIIDMLGPQFPRLKIGVGRPQSPEYPVEEYVLSRFSAGEKKMMAKVFLTVQEGIVCWISDDIQTCMRQFNKRQNRE